MHINISVCAHLFIEKKVDKRKIGRKLKQISHRYMTLIISLMLLYNMYFTLQKSINAKEGLIYTSINMCKFMRNSKESSELILKM